MEEQLQKEVKESSVRKEELTDEELSGLSGGGNPWQETNKEEGR